MDAVMQEIEDEAARAAGKYGPPTSTHESLGVLLEEFDELKEAIHANHAERIAHEAIQVAVVALRLARAIKRDDLNFWYRSGLNTQPKRAA